MKKLIFTFVVLSLATSAFADRGTHLADPENSLPAYGPKSYSAIHKEGIYAPGYDPKKKKAEEDAHKNDVKRCCGKR